MHSLDYVFQRIKISEKKVIMEQLIKYLFEKPGDIPMTKLKVNNMSLLLWGMLLEREKKNFHVNQYMNIHLADICFKKFSTHHYYSLPRYSHLKSYPYQTATNLILSRQQYSNHLEIFIGSEIW